MILYLYKVGTNTPALTIKNARSYTADSVTDEDGAGLACGLWRDTGELAALRRSQRVFLPQRPQADCDDEYRLWKKAVSRACHWAE